MGAKIHIKTDPDLQSFLPTYLENRKRDLQELRTALEKKDFKSIQITSHKIRGHGVSYGFTQLSQICTKIERAIIENRLDTIDSLLNEYQDYIERVEL